MGLKAAGYMFRARSRSSSTSVPTVGCRLISHSEIGFPGLQQFFIRWGDTDCWIDINTISMFARSSRYFLSDISYDARDFVIIVDFLPDREPLCVV